MFSFLHLFALNNTANPTPAPEQSPATHEPKLMAPAAYSCVSAAETAQLGISPKRAVIKG